MAADVEAPEVIIVGAGPVGLSLALGLARAGRRVLVLERRSTTAEHSRAAAIWPPTQQILASLGVLDSFLAEAIALDRLDLVDADTGERLLSLPLRELASETAHPRLLVLPQSRTERLLLDALRGHERASVRFSAEVLEVEEGGSRVSVRYAENSAPRAVEGAYVVGCDGARSTVREGLGLGFEGETYRTRAALADVRVPGTGELPFPRLTTRAEPAVGIRIAPDLWRLILPLSGEEDAALDERVERTARRIFPVVDTGRDYEMVWKSEFRLHRRVASRFVSGRVALAGDAAHLNSPVGGQGMNAGIRDAAVLTAALMEALRDDEPRRLLRYERERRSAVRQGVNRHTDRMTRLLLLGNGRAMKPVLRLAGTVLRVPSLRRRILRRLAMLHDE